MKTGIKQLLFYRSGLTIWRISRFMMVGAILWMVSVQAQSVDTSVISTIKTMASGHDPARQVASFCRLAGSRLNGSEGYDAAVAMLTDSLMKYGFAQVHAESFPSSFKNWKLTGFRATIVSPDVRPVNAVPRDYTCGTNGIVRGELFFPGTFKMEKLQAFSGKLKGKIVLIDSPMPPKVNLEPLSSRWHDTTLQRMAGLPVPSAETIEQRKSEEKEYGKKLIRYFTRQAEIIAFMEKEGVAGLVFGGRIPYGVVQSMNAFTSDKPEGPFDAFFYAASAGKQVRIPQITIDESHYYDLVMAVRAGKKIEMELMIGVAEGAPKKGCSLLAEITGTDLKDEIVMIGGHLDAYTAGQGATDNAAGVFICIEALRILKETGIKPRRTIRLALWGSEEMADFLGSGSYVKEHFIDRHEEKLFAYFNSDQGAGAFRGIYAQESAAAKSVFDSWIPLINESRFSTISPEFTGDTDHISFYEAGLPGFQFIQDPLDYKTIFHSNMDIPMMIPPEDIKFNAMIMAIVAWLASELGSPLITD